MKSYVKGKKDTPSEEGAVTVVAKVRPTFTPSGEMFYEMISGTPLTRCAECKHGEVLSDSLVHCTKHETYMELQDFCSRGEKHG